MKRPARRFASCGFGLLLAACASPVPMRPTVLTPTVSHEHPGVFLLVSDLEVDTDSGYSRALPRGYKLTPAGVITEGEVYRPTEGVFTVEGAHMHEAWLVIRQGRLVGFYLPVENSFVSLSKTQPIQLNK